MDNPYDGFDDYGLRYLPVHLIDAELWDELGRILTQLTFIEAKCGAGMTYELVGDYEIALSVWPEEESKITNELLTRLETFGSTLRIESHVISTHPELTFQQFFNLLYWRKPADEQTRHLLETIAKRRCTPWFRSLRPPVYEVGGPLVCTLTHPGEPAACVSFDPDGHNLFSGSLDGIVRMWDFRTGEFLALFGGEDKPVVSCFGSTSRDFVAAGTRYGDFVIWNLQDGTIVRRFQIPHKGEIGRSLDPTSGQYYWITHLALASDGRTLVVSFENLVRPPLGFLGLYDSLTGELKRGEPLENLPVRVWASQRVMGMTWVVNAVGERGIVVWEVESGRTIAKVQTQRATTRGCAISRDGTRLALSTDTDCRVLFLSLPEGRLVSYSTELGDRVHQERVRCCCFTPMGKSLISADKEGKIIIWDSESEPSTRGIASYDAHAGEISAMAISPDGKFLATAGSDNLVKIWDLDLIIESHPLERDNHEEAVYCCMYSSDGATAYTGSVQRMVRSSALYRWKTESGFPSLDQRMPTSLGIYEISSMAMLPSFGLLAYIKTIESSLVLCDPTSGSLIQQMNIPYECKVLQLIPATEHLLLLRPYRSLGRPYGSYSDNIRSREGESGDVFLFDPAKKSLDVFLTADGVKRSCMCISRDSSLLVFGTEDSELELWDLSGKCRLDVVSIGESPVRSCSVAPDGRTIVVGLLDGSIGVLDYLPGGQAAAPNLVKAHDGPVNWCGFMRTRHLLITCGVDKTVLAWKWPGPRALARYICSGAIWSAAIHPQRNELLVGDIGGQCYFLALEAGQGSRRQRHSIKR